MVSRLNNFLDADGRVKQWPARRSVQLEVIKYIANHFDGGEQYSETELNSRIKDLHTFGDWAIIRRELCDLEYFERDTSSTTYTRTSRTQ